MSAAVTINLPAFVFISNGLFVLIVTASITFGFSLLLDGDGLDVGWKYSFNYVMHYRIEELFQCIRLYSFHPLTDSQLSPKNVLYHSENGMIAYTYDIRGHCEHSLSSLINGALARSESAAKITNEECISMSRGWISRTHIDVMVLPVQHKSRYLFTLP